MLTLVRNIPLEPGHNHVGLSAEHRLLGVEWSDSCTGNLAVELVMAENTSVSDNEAGLVYRDIYVAMQSEYLPFSISSVLEHFYLPATALTTARVVFVLPARKR